MATLGPAIRRERQRAMTYLVRSRLNHSPRRRAAAGWPARGPAMVRFGLVI